MATIILRPAHAADIPEMAALRAREWETEAHWTDRITNYLQASQSPRQAAGRNVRFLSLGMELLWWVSWRDIERAGWAATPELQWT